MQKLKLLLTGIALLIISAILADDISLYNITPCILLPWVVYISIVMESKYALSFTFFIGLSNDLLNPQLLGFTTMLFLLLSHFIYTYHTSVNKGKFTTTLLSMLVINLIFYMAQYVFFAFTSPEPLNLLIKTLITIGYNTILSCILIYIIFLLDKLRMWFGE